MYQPGNYFGKLKLLFTASFKRLADVLRASDYDVLFIQREAFMLGTVLFERLLKLSKARIIFDFDDSIWLQDVSEINRNLSFLKDPLKTAKIISLSDRVFAGNAYLANYALKYNLNVRIIPTTIDTDEYFPTQRSLKNEKIVIGWSGSFSTIKHFSLALPALKRIQEIFKDKVEFHVIGNSQFKTPLLEIISKDWNKLNELEDLQEFDIGIMPLPNDEWSQGKCGLKGLQYMALEIPTIMSPVGVNKDIIQDGVNGYLAGSDKEWVDKLSMLIQDYELRIKIGTSGRKTVVEKYSVVSQRGTYIDEFENLLNKK